MGIEYRLRFRFSDPAQLHAAVRRIPGALEVSEPTPRFEFLNPFAPQQRPDATVILENDGVYFCDHCGENGDHLLGEVTARLTAAFGPVALEEL